MLSLLRAVSYTLTKRCCGTVGFDREIFSGAPSFEKLMAQYPGAGSLTEEEQKFLAEETDELCAMVDDFEVLQDKDFNVGSRVIPRRASRGSRPESEIP